MFRQRPHNSRRLFVDTDAGDLQKRRLGQREAFASAWAKLLMMVQSLTSLTTVALLAARAVNIL
jgi:hypothetical protein